MRPYEEFLPDFYGMALKDREIITRTDHDGVDRRIELLQEISRENRDHSNIF